MTQVLRHAGPCVYFCCGSAHHFASPGIKHLPVIHNAQQHLHLLIISFFFMLAAKSAGANVRHLLVAGLLALPGAVVASVDGDLGEAPIGYGDLGVNLNDEPTPQVPGATLPGATLSSTKGFDTSSCSALPDTTARPAS